MCSIDCADAICEVLEQSGLYRVKMIGPDSFPKLEFIEENIKNADCIVIPVGLGDSDQFDHHLINKKKMVQNYVKNGGKYLGICMGSYFADHHYFDILTGVTAEQYIKRKNKTVRRSTHDIVDLIWGSKQATVYFHDGAAFIPVDNNKISGIIIARYKNGDVAAMIQSYGRGTVGVVGPHPEAMKWWFYSQNRNTNRWHDCVRHDLMLDLVIKLMHED
jgi:glutamine amidotransferase-like uncharacterized protein